MHSKKTADRNSRIRQYKAKNPKMTTRAIGRVFKVSHVIVVRALNEVTQ